MQVLGGDADSLIEAALPEKGGLATVLTAYFDESERERGVFAVAGFAYAPPQAKRCRLEWEKVFRKYGGCHMTDLALAQGVFKGISLKESARLIREAIAIINERASFGVAISCHLAEIEPLLPKWIRGFEGAYPVCCHIAMTALGHLVRQKNECAAYFFESGHKHQARAHDFMSRTLDTPELRESYRHYSHTFADKSNVALLQTADVLAWEWAKYIDETVLTPQRPMRKSLGALLTQGTFDPNGFDTERFKLSHITGEPLKNFVRQVEALGLLQVMESRLAQLDRLSPR